MTQEQDPESGSPASGAQRGLVRCSKCQTIHRLHDLLAACPGCGVPSAAMTDNDLVDALYRAYAVPLLRFVQHLRARRGMSESLLDTEGVVHETFTAILRSVDTIRNPRGWLFVVAARLVGKCADEHRRRWAGDVPDDLVHSGAARWSSLPPQADVEDICEARRVLKDIAERPNRQMIAVYLHHVQGWTAKEIGEYLGCAESTAGVHIHRGIKRLRRESHSPARRRLNTLGKIGFAAFIGGVVVDQLIRVWTYRPPAGCPGGHPPPCPPPQLPPPAGLGDLVRGGVHPVVVLVVVAVVVLLGLVATLVAEPRWRAIRRRRPCGNTRIPQESPNNPANT